MVSLEESLPECLPQCFKPHSGGVWPWCLSLLHNLILLAVLPSVTIISTVWIVPISKLLSCSVLWRGSLDEIELCLVTIS